MNLPAARGGSARSFYRLTCARSGHNEKYELSPKLAQIEWPKWRIVAVLWIGGLAITSAQAAFIGGLLGSPRLKSTFVQSRSEPSIRIIPRSNDLDSSNFGVG